MPSDDSLVYDGRPKGCREPGLHLLLVGASTYPNAELAKEKISMSPLTCCAVSAVRLYEWFMERFTKHPKYLDRPLHTVRLLISPSEDEQPIIADILGKVDKLTGASSPATIADATVGNFELASEAWRDDANSHSDGVTLFYFAGHGLDLGQAESVILFSDFGTPGGLLSKGVHTRHIMLAMGPSTRHQRIARTQYFLYDNCRTHCYHLRDAGATQNIPYFDKDTGITDLRTVVPFYSCMSGQTAEGNPRAGTLFCDGLIKCLNWNAAVLPLAYPAPATLDDRDTCWRVTSDSLLPALTQYFNRLPNSPEQRPDQRFGQYYNGHPTIVYLDHTPEVDLKIHFSPDHIVARSEFTVWRFPDADVHYAVSSIDANPWTATVPGGQYQLNAHAEHDDTPYRYDRCVDVIPREHHWLCQLRPPKRSTHDRGAI
jgi:hypothetical protein